LTCFLKPRDNEITKYVQLERNFNMLSHAR